MMKAFFVIIILSHWHGHAERHVQTAGWMTEHQCHLRAHWIEEQHPYTEAHCEARSEHHSWEHRDWDERRGS